MRHLGVPFARQMLAKAKSEVKKMNVEHCKKGPTSGMGGKDADSRCVGTCSQCLDAFNSAAGVTHTMVIVALHPGERYHTPGL